MSDLVRVFVWLCSMDTDYSCAHVSVYPATWCAEFTGLPLRRVRDAMRRLERYGYIRKDSEGGWDDWNCRIYCVHGYAITEKGRETSIWKKADRLEIERIKEALRHDNERSEDVPDAVP